MILKLRIKKSVCEESGVAGVYCVTTFTHKLQPCPLSHPYFLRPSGQPKFTNPKNKQHFPNIYLTHINKQTKNVVIKKRIR